jgi:hypothetical protein
MKNTKILPLEAEMKKLGFMPQLTIMDSSNLNKQ